MYDLNAPAPKSDEASGSQRPDPLVGRTFNGRFRIEARLAKGGMGKVYRAQQVPLGRPVALKVLNVAVAPEHVEAFHRRFFIEAATAARLSHPHTVTIFDYGCSDDGIYYIAMEYLEGQSLRQLLRKAGPLSPRRAVALAIQIARAVREAHGLGFMHRDLKPANVMLREDDDGRDFAKVLDFGLAKSADAASDLTRTGQFLGSPGYMAPEQIRGAPLDARCDIYALGAMLYEMLTGQQPFARQGPVDTLMAHVHEPVPTFAEMDAGVDSPEALEDVVRACLAKKPQDRPDTMSALMAALRAAVAHLPHEEGLLRRVPLDEYEASGWAVVSPTGALRVKLDLDMDAAPVANANQEPLTLLGFDKNGADAARDEATASHVLQAPEDVPTSHGAAISAAAISADPELPTLFFAPPRAPGRTIIGTSPVAVDADVEAAAKDAPKSRASWRDAAGRLLLASWLLALSDGPRTVAPTQSVPSLGLTEVTWHLRTAPAGAMVWHGDALICRSTPCDITLQLDDARPAPALRFFADGYDEYFTNRYQKAGEQTFVVALTQADSAI